MPSARTNIGNDGFTERRISATYVCRWLRLRSVNTEAPASAIQAGVTPLTDSEAANSTSVSAMTAKVNTGGRGVDFICSGSGYT